MRRREFITLLGGAAVWASPARAQEPRRVIGFLCSGSSDSFPGPLAAFVQGLKDTGFIEGNNISIEWRWAGGQYDRLPSLAGELVSHGAAVIVGFDAPASFAAKAATKTIPIVFMTGADPVKTGLVDSFNRPGGNLTGVTALISMLGPKRLELLSELLPSTSTIALLVNPNNPNIGADAQRRQVTVMFSDLVGSTALAARMDPEDLREVISAYQKCVAETVRRFGGFVAKYMGDGVLVYFGYPQAHEDDAERAVRAGLELIGAVTALKPNAPLQTRVGIATGLVVVGDLIGSGEAQERGIVGETPNLAARLQGVAEPNTVVIAEGTRRLLGNLFELEDLGPKDLKGIAGPVQAWAALRVSSAEGRFDALHASGLTELVGREEELELLLRRWSKAKTGEGQVVLLSGEAGIGKSRLTAALLDRLASEPHTRLRYFCSPQHTDSALYPVISQMERAAGFVHYDTARTRLDRLDAVLAQTLTSTEDAALFAEMLSLPNDGRYPKLDLTPEQRRQRTLEALVSQMETLTWQNPLLMIFEDAHWTDPTSLELFGRIIDRIPSLRVLLIVTFRPEFEPPWIGRPYVTALTINRLAEREIDAMIDRVVGNKGSSWTLFQNAL